MISKHVPRPFCGGVAALTFPKVEGDDPHVFCPDCPAKAMDAEAWNCRPPASVTEAAAVREFLTATMAKLGWKLVPREATEEMTTAANTAIFESREDNFDPKRRHSPHEKHTLRWRAMFDVAPSTEPSP